jgi:hypothetical protein
MADLALRAQGLFQSLVEALNSLPLWAILALVFFPTILSLAAFVASLIFVMFGMRERLLWRHLSGLEAQVGRIDEQMMTFLSALEKRSDILDERTDEARSAFREARQAYEEIRRASQAAAKAPLQTAPTFTVGPVAGASVNTPQKIAPVETGAVTPSLPKSET